MSTWHANLGYDRQLSDEPHVCSKCCAEISDEHVPLILFGPGDLAFVYCAHCEGEILAMARPAAGGMRQ